eukprot:820010_1
MESLKSCTNDSNNGLMIIGADSLKSYSPKYRHWSGESLAIMARGGTSSIYCLLTHASTRLRTAYPSIESHHNSVHTIATEPLGYIYKYDIDWIKNSRKRWLIYSAKYESTEQTMQRDSGRRDCE